MRISDGVQTCALPISVNLAPDGRVIGQPRVVDAMRMNRDAYFRSAAENAVRAIFKCSPFDLPVAQYTEWKTMNLTFNPSEMFGSCRRCIDRKSVVWGKNVAVRLDLGGRRIIKKKNN